MTAYLKYVGNGGSLAGVPARDLTRAEAQAFGIDRLVKTNLYKLASPASVKSPKNKASFGGLENKSKE